MKHQFEIEKILDAEIEKVWQVISEGELMSEWMIPNGFVSSYAEYNFHLGGQYRVGMRDQNGEEYFIVGSYLNIVQPSLLEFTHAWENTDGLPGEETKVSIQLFSEGPDTKLIFRQEGFSSSERAEGHHAGWEECLNKLQNLITNKPLENEADDQSKEIAETTSLIKTEIIIKAPIASVWEALSEPDMILKWWGPKNYSSPSCEIDFSVGGKYLCSMEDEKGNVSYSTGIYKEIDPGRKIVYTDSFADEDGNVIAPSLHGLINYPNECLVTMYLSSRDGDTLLSITQDGITDPIIRDNVTISWQESLEKLKKITEEA